MNITEYMEDMIAEETSRLSILLARLVWKANGLSDLDDSLAASFEISGEGWRFVCDDQRSTRRCADRLEDNSIEDMIAALDHFVGLGKIDKAEAATFDQLRQIRKSEG